jgi:hypothetical protein
LELQEICNFNPPFRSKGKTEEQVTVWLKEASPLLEPNDQKKISTETEDILYQLGLWPFNEDGKKIEDAEEVETVADNPDIIAEIEEASSVRQLKDIARTYDEFKGIRNSLTAYKKTDDLRVYMLEYLNPEVPEEVEEKKVEKKPVPKPKPAPKKAEEKPASEKKTGIPSKGVSKEEKVKFIAPLIKEGKYTKGDIVKKCVQKFPNYKESTWQTILSDAKNPKYSIFDKPVVVADDGILTFGK